MSDRKDTEAATRRPKDLTDVLLALPLDDFNALRATVSRKLERAKAEVARLEFERQQLEEAAAVARAS